jgi:hypothetical protein
MLLEYAETDWLGSRPVFYNEKTGKISYNINEVIDYASLRFHPEGLRNYLKFGYTILGQTAIQDVKALRHDSSISKDADGKLHIEEHEDSLLKLYGMNKKTGTDVFEELLASVRQYVGKEDNEIVLPLSSGYDSRLLALACSQANRDKINAFSYGYSVRQYDSYETVRASVMADRLNIRWKHIPLGDYYAYIDEWNDLYGISVHAHGMYQMEFYKKIMKHMTDIMGYSGDLSLVSGIIGDAWAGSVRIGSVNSPEDLIKLGYTHGICIDEDICLVGKDTNELKNGFLEEHRQQLKEENWRTIYAMRMKMMLLHYLLTTPSAYGMKTYSPFLDKNLAIDMLNLDWSEKTERRWQKECFEKYGLDIEWMKSKCDFTSTLNELAICRNPLQPLNVYMLSRIVKKEYVEWVNEVIAKKPMNYISAKPKTPQNMYNKFVRRMNADWRKANNGYMVLLPLQRVMEKAENCDLS